MTYEFQILAPATQDRPKRAPYDRWLSEDGEETARFARDGDDYVVDFPGIGQFIIAADDQVDCIPEPGSDRDLLADKFANQIVPLIMGRRGQPVLHGSAVDIGSKAIAFLGPTRRGKSTLAGAFATSGHPVLTDDGLILDRTDDELFVRPRTASLRLCSDSEQALSGRTSATTAEAGVKQRVTAGQLFPFQNQPVELAAIFLLTRPQGVADVRIAALSRPDALSALLQHAFILDVEDRDRLRALFDWLIGVVSAVRCYSLDYPRDFERLPMVRQSIIAHFNEEGGVE